LANVDLKRHCKLLVFTIISAVSLYDLAYAYQITSKQVHSPKSYDIISSVQDGGQSFSISDSICLTI